jgi:Lon protease-like protein
MMGRKKNAGYLQLVIVLRMNSSHALRAVWLLMRISIVLGYFVGMSHCFSGNQRRLRIDAPPFVVGRNLSEDNTGDHQSSLIYLPIFPLRKYPRLPTDSLTLNLYEERYLRMSEDCLLSASTRSVLPIFGALFVSDLPQIVPKGRGPVTPMLQVGQIGTLFVVADSQQGKMPTKGRGFDRRRCIRLNARGVARFRVDRIVSDGTGGIDEDNGRYDNKHLPYLLVNATLVTDDDTSIFQAARSDEMEGVVFHQTTTPVLPLWGGFITRNHSQSASTQSRLSEFENIFIAIKRLIPLEQWGLDHARYRNELLSFFSASQRMGDGTGQRPKDLEALLKMTSKQARADALKRL